MKNFFDDLVIYDNTVIVTHDLPEMTGICLRYMPSLFFTVCPVSGDEGDFLKFFSDDLVSYDNTVIVTPG